MRLWTTQPLEVWEQLEKDGVFRCDETRSKYGKDFKDAYAWMIQEMDKRMEHPCGCVLPMWAWHIYNWKHKKPDLRGTGFGDKGEKTVCIELEVPDNQVLLSDYNAWHYVLNHSWYDDSQNEEEWEELRDWYDKLPGDVRYKFCLESWQKIFDVTQVKTDWYSNGAYVQATFWELRKEYVKKVQFFTAR